MAFELKTKIPPALTDQTFFLFARAAGRVLTATDRFLTPFHIGHQHYSVLLMLADGKEWSQSRLAKAIGIEKTRMVGLIDMLELRRYVKREQNPEDRREYKLLLTAEGKDAVSQIQSLLTKEKPAYLKALSEAELHYINVMLNRTIECSVGQPSRRKMADQERAGEHLSEIERGSGAENIPANQTNINQ